MVDTNESPGLPLINMNLNKSQVSIKKFKK